MDSIRNNKHEVVGFMDDHHVYDNAYGVVGTFAEDTILDMQSQIIARMDGNLIRDHLYRIIGWADADDIRDVPVQREMDNLRLIKRMRTVVPLDLRCVF